MLQVSEAYTKAIKAEVRQMLHRVTIDGTSFDQTRVSHMTFSESIGNNTGVMLGTANSASLSFSIREPKVMDYTDLVVKAESGIMLPNGTIEWIPLGTFYVTECSTSDNYRTVDLTCADGMYLMSGEYISELTYPALVKDVAHEIAEQAGIELVDMQTWANVYVRKKPEDMTLRNAIGCVAGCCGRVARFNRYGALELIWYKDTDAVISLRQQYMGGLTKLNDQPLDIAFNVTGEQERYNIEVITNDNGNVIANPGYDVLENETVKLSIVTFYGYQLSTITATTSTGAHITLWRNADGDEYTFIQPDSDVTINAVFVESGSTSVQAISDISEVAVQNDGIPQGNKSRSENATTTIEYTNPMITAKTMADVSALVEGVSYMPLRVKYRGNPAYEVGDIISVEDKDGSYHQALIIDQTMIFGGGMNTTITCPGRTEKQANFSANSSLNQRIDQAVRSESYYQKKATDDYNSMVVSALSRSMSSMSRQVTDDGVIISSLSEWRDETSVSLIEITEEVNRQGASITYEAARIDEQSKKTATLEQTVSEQGASIGLIVSDGEIRGGMVIEAINGETVSKISADRLDIEGKELNIKVDAANITGLLTAEQIDATNLEVDAANITGKLTAAQIDATDLVVTKANITSGDIGGFLIDHNSLYTNSTFKNSSLILSSSGTESSITVNGVTKRGWKILSGSEGSSAKNFGVDDDGYLYASGVTVSGLIEASEGSIGSLNIDNDGLAFVSGSGNDYRETTLFSNNFTFARGIGSHFSVSETSTASPYGLEISAQVGHGDAPVTFSMTQNGAAGTGSLGGGWDISVNGSYGDVDLVSWMQALYDSFSGLQSFIDVTSDYLINRGISCPQPTCSIPEELLV